VVRQILKEDEYTKISEREILPGDVALYVASNGDVEHSGVVVEMTSVGPRILSKWGNCQEVIHMVGDCPYPGATMEYWRYRNEHASRFQPRQR
jgi:hypothetical protein